MGKRRGTSPVKALTQWFQRRSFIFKFILGAIITLFSLVALKLSVRNHDNLFVASEIVHALGILILIYKLTIHRSCSGLSLKSQELTAIFLAARLVCSVMIEGDIHTFLDSLTLAATIWVIYMLRFKLNASYNKELDTMPLYYVVIPCAILSIFVHSQSLWPLLARVLWSFCLCVEAISVLPQLRFMQNAKMVESFTAHYVFALGISRFVGCANWIFKIYETGGKYLVLAGKGHLYILLILVAEIVQTFILADFCYYYIKR
ncbi:putative ER lumen protein-retaining receptor C28H8.4 [Chenopodium quinoa]|uniref:putative ER lumen protein-retaining receptor C28H8.4 n=1 Tax=Chenopodium quinoa TaxID=63459 RepID=UPI000B77C7CA|nr:putative ER lumen protein-retaining receptor C28H8.4 [Chenopodium quinoa]